MSPSRWRTNEQGRPRPIRISWRGVALGVIRWFVLLVTFFAIVNLWFGTGVSLSGRLVAPIALSLLVASLAYWLFVSSRVRLSFPGIDRGVLESGEGVPTASGDSVATVQVFRLDGATASIVVENDSPLPVLRACTAVELEREAGAAGSPDELATDLVMGPEFSVPAHGVRPAMVANVFDHVGIFRLRSAGVRVWDLIGLLSRVRGAHGRWRVRVVPNVYRLERGIPRDRDLSQTTLGIPDTPSDALDYDRVREYRPGDPLKTIHWKVVAHSNGELYTKLFETATVSGAMLLVDPVGPDAQAVSPDMASHMYDTMLEGGFSLMEYARQSGIPGRLRFVDRGGSLIESTWEGMATLGWYVETARRPSRTQAALGLSAESIRSLRNGGVGYVVFATSCLTEQSVRELVACRRAGVAMLVVHALPVGSQTERTRQESLDAQLRRASIDVIALEDGRQIVREVAAP